MRNGKVANVVLWTLQVLLAGMFVFAGAIKLTMPGEVLAAQTGLPALFMRFVSLTEVAGGLGVLVPGLFRLHRELTPIAAGALAVVMVGAVVVSVLRVSVGAAVMPFVVGVLLVTVLRGRRGWVVSPS